jgi:general secretion pathway protein N
MMGPNRRIILFSVAAPMIALIAFFPLRLALAMGGLGNFPVTARAAEGSIWSGRLRGVALDGIAVGDFKTGLSVPSLLTGKLAFALNSLGSDGGKALVFSTSGGLGVEGLTAALAIPGAFDPLPIDSVELTSVNVSFSDGKCRSASGQVRVALAFTFGSVPLGQQLIGTLRCDGSAVLLPLASQSTLERARVRFVGDGQYTTQFSLKPANPEDAAKLTAMGFRETPGGYVFELSGKL